MNTGSYVEIGPIAMNDQPQTLKEIIDEENRNAPGLNYNFERKLIIFFDILGWANLTSSMGQQIPKKYKGIFHSIAAWAASSKIHRQHDPKHPLVFFFSDTFVFVSDLDEAAVSQAFQFAIFDLSVLLELGLTCRGSITVGNILTDDQLIVGPSLVRAYKDLERKLAVHPRIIVDPQHIDEISAMSAGPNERSMWKMDTDGMLILDYLHCQRTSLGQLYKMKKKFLKKISRASSPKIRLKLEYIADYIRYSIKAERKFSRPPRI